MSDKVDFEAKKIIRQKWTLYNDNRFNPPRRLAILNVSTPNNRAAKYVKQKLTELKEKKFKSTILVGNFNSSRSTTHRTRKKINKDTKELKNTMKQTSTNLKEIILNIFSNYNRIKLEIGNRRITGNSPNT